MVSYSQNGFPANDRSHITNYIVGNKTKFALRKGPTGWLLAHFADWFDRNIRDIDAGAVMDDWSYAERPIRGSTTTLSNHASGTAIDIDATKWPLGVEPTRYLSKDEISRLKRHLQVYEGAIRWGGDYTGRKDPMHFEIDKPEAFCARIQQKLQGGQPQEDEMASEDVKKLLEMVGGIHYMLVPPGGYHGPAGDVITKIGALQWAVGAILAREPSSVDVDAEAIAKAIPDDLAEQVARRLADRLAE